MATIIHDHYDTESIAYAALADKLGRWAFAKDTKRILVNDENTIRYYSVDNDNRINSLAVQTTEFDGTETTSDPDTAFSLLTNAIGPLTPYGGPITIPANKWAAGKFIRMRSRVNLDHAETINFLSTINADTGHANSISTADLPEAFAAGDLFLETTITCQNSGSGIFSILQKLVAWDGALMQTVFTDPDTYTVSGYDCAAATDIDFLMKMIEPGVTEENFRVLECIVETNIQGLAA